jgi:hypothetical protein
VTVGRMDEKVNPGTSGAGTTVGLDQSGTFSVEQDWPDGHCFGGSLGDNSVEEGSGPPTLPGPLDSVGATGSVSQKLGVLIVG